MIKLSPAEISGERTHGERTDLTVNLELLAEYLDALDAPLRQALAELPRSRRRDRALMVLAVIPAWREFVRGMAIAARQDQAVTVNDFPGWRDFMNGLVQTVQQWEQVMEEECT
jgi:hypothetical protein